MENALLVTRILFAVAAVLVFPGGQAVAKAQPAAAAPAAFRLVPARIDGTLQRMVANGRVVEHWSVYDSLQMLQQLELFRWGEGQSDP